MSFSGLVVPSENLHSPLLLPNLAFFFRSLSGKSASENGSYEVAEKRVRFKKAGEAQACEISSGTCIVVGTWLLYDGDRLRAEFWTGGSGDGDG